MNLFQAGGPDGGTSSIDDVYICDDTGAHCNTFLGDIKVLDFLPTSDGDLTDWTPSTGSTHYTLVDETTPNTTDNISSVVVTNTDLFHFQSVSAISLYALQIVHTVKTASGGANTIASASKISGAVYIADNLEVPATYQPRINILEVNPATGLPWTGAQVNASQFGVKLTA